MNRTEKQDFVGDFRDKVQEAPVLYLTDFSGLDVKSMTLLRQRLRDSGAEYLVVKNRLVKLAVADLDLPDISEALLGPTGVVFGYEGIVEPAKAVSDFAKEHDDKPVFKLGILDKQLVTADEIQRLAKLPPRDQLLAELAGALEAPMAALASALEAKIQEMSGLFEALKEQKEAQPADAEADTAQADADTAKAKADTAEADADTAKAKADTAEAEADTAAAEVETVETEAEAQTETVEAEAEAETVEAEAEEQSAEPEAAAEPADTEEEKSPPEAEDES